FLGPRDDRRTYRLCGQRDVEPGARPSARRSRAVHASRTRHRARPVGGAQRGHPRARARGRRLGERRAESPRHVHRRHGRLRAPVLKKKVSVLGAFGVGKTSLVRRYVESIFSDTYLTTVGVKVDKKVLEVAGRQVTLVLWDVAGEDDTTSIRMSYVRG